METLLPIAVQYGIAGLVLLASGWFILYRDKVNNSENSIRESRHESERKEWRTIIDQQHQECIQARIEATQAVNENTKVLTKISTLIEDRR